MKIFIKLLKKLKGGIVLIIRSVISLPSIKANYRQENPLGSRTLGDFPFSVGSVSPDLEALP